MDKIRLFTYVFFYALGFTQLNASTPPPVQYEYMLLDMCDGKAAAYLKFYQDTTVDTTITRITRIDISTIDQAIPSVLTDITDGEAEIYNLIPVNDFIEFEVKVYDSKGRVTIRRIRINTKDDGKINVTERLYQYIDEFTKTNASLYTYWCGKKISRVELFAFFQQYLKLTPEQICTMVAKYNQITGRGFTEEVIENSAWLQHMCQLFTFFQSAIGSGGNQNECICKLIGTKQSALNVQGESNYNQPDNCMNYLAYTNAHNYDNRPNDNDLIFSQGRIGAAKAARMHIFYDGVDSSPTNFSVNLAQGWSTVRFRLVCLSSVTLTPDLENCKACKKRVEVEYGYYSKTFLTASSQTCVFCTQGAWMTIEDWAMLFITKNGQLQDSVIQGQRKYQAICDNPDEPGIDSVLTTTQSLVQAISTALGSATTANIFAAATAAYTAYQTIFAETLCDQLNIDNHTLFTGQNQYDIGPGEELKFTVISNATFGGRVKNHGTAIGQINSDFYLAAVLTTVPDPIDGVPPYCECEKIGAYVLGSLNTSVERIPHVDEPNNTAQSDWTLVFDDPPFGLTTMQALVGSFIGLRGPWPGAFETTNCCDVKINCMSDCVSLTGCGDNPVVGKGMIINDQKILESLVQNVVLTEMSDLSISAKNAGQRALDRNLVVYPNPVASAEIFIDNRAEKEFRKISLWNMEGKLLVSQDWPEGYAPAKLIYQLPDLMPGIYILVLLDKDNNYFYTKILRP
ncbi:MAG: T9SS type A sorting domain-containing protein [Saprospiraceae bacterium]|nr:T9SS type A sorting domain-containing protein [Saprospiraceae bacterium]